ncbi:hypothetical protein BGZ94_010443 [Podila epigama]|nr:hypothetical protein BGZ94_010443 [Podila epigama]
MKSEVESSNKGLDPVDKAVNSVVNGATVDNAFETASISSLESADMAHNSRRYLFGIFIVNSNITYLNFCTYLVACFGTICLVVYLAIIQPFVLTVILGIDGKKGNLTGSLGLYDEIIALPFTLIWGLLSDRIGRRYVYSIGFLCLGTALILFPLSKNVYPHLLLCRLLFSIGSAAATTMMTGALGDIAGGQRERGRTSAIVGLFSGFGGLIAGMVLTKVPYMLVKQAGSEIKGIQLCFQIVGGTAIAFAAFSAFAMPKFSHGKDYMNPLKMLKYGFLAARDPRVALAYVSSFVARADTVLFTSYMSLWVVHYFEQLGYCQNGHSCSAAAGDTHTLTGYGQGISLAFAPLFGFAGEKFAKSTVLAVAGIIGAIGSFPFAFTKVAPAHKSNFAFITMVGIGQIGVIVTGMTLINGVYMKPKYRGSVAGVFSFCGAVSIMIMVKLGGYLFDAWMPGAPFVLMGGAHALISIFAIYVRLITPRLEAQDRQRLMDAGEEYKEHCD